MTNAKHTPGPWTVAIPIELTFPDDKARQESAYEIQTEDGGATLCYTVGTDADTRLIAAAPTMYEFLASKARSGDSEASRILESIHGHAERNNPLERR